MERFPENTDGLQTPKPQNLCNRDYIHQNDEAAEEDNEEALSLRDLPLNTPQPSIATAADRHDPPPTEFFEFLSSTSDDLSPAENIIFCGKLIPLNDQRTFSTPACPEKAGHRIRVRSESLSAIQGGRLSRSGSVTRGSDIKLKRNSRSLDYRKLSRDSSNDVVNSLPEPEPEPERKLMEKILPAKITARLADTTTSFGGKGVRPRWYVMMFGKVKFPPEIELRDMKSRQYRRNIPPVMFPSSSERNSRGRSSPPSTSWKFLKALSCKEPNSAVATTPFWVPHAR